MAAVVELAARDRAGSDALYDGDARRSWVGLNNYKSFYEANEDALADTIVAGKRTRASTRSLIESIEQGNAEIQNAPVQTFGTVFGVFLPCLQNILGVILFLRLPWIVGQAGILLSITIVVLCVVSTLLTTLSMSALATNGRISGGGPYGILLSNLGPEFAGSIGVLFYLGTTIAATMYTLGGVEALFTIFLTSDTVLFTFDRQIIGIVWSYLLGAIVLAGMKWVAKASLLFLVVVLSAVFFMTIGVIVFAAGVWSPTGVVASSSPNENVMPAYSADEATGKMTDFTFLLALFYPSVTGIMAGSNRSAVLANPARAIPKGTLGAIFSTTTIYLFTIVMFGLFIANETLKTNKLVAASVAWPHEYVVAVGIIMSTVGAGLQCLAGAPQLLRSIANDGHIPFLRFFGTERMDQEPRRAVLLTTTISALACLAGNLDYITPIITMFFLTMYAGINAACFLSGALKSPSFRPTWRYFHWTTALLGFLVCLTFMLLISVLYACVAFILVSGIFLYIRRVRESKEWGDAMFGLRLDQAKNALLDLSDIHVRQRAKDIRRRRQGATLRNRKSSTVSAAIEKSKSCCAWPCAGASDGKAKNDDDVHSDVSIDVEEQDDELNSSDEEWFEETDAYMEQSGGHIKQNDWRPQILVLCKLRISSPHHHEHGDPHVPSKRRQRLFRTSHPSLLQLASQLKKGRGLTIVNSVIHGSVLDPESKIICARARHFLAVELQRQELRGFTDVVLHAGRDMGEAFRVLFQSKGLGMLSPNTVMLSWPATWREDRSPEDRAYTSALGECNPTDPALKTDCWHHMASYVQILKDAVGCQKALIVVKSERKFLPKTEVVRPIDVWWLIHDGDLLVLLPYLLKRHKIWNKAKLRIFAIADDLIDFAKSQAKLSSHLADLRIEAEIIMVAVGASHARDVDVNRTVAAPSEERKRGISILNKNMFRPLAQQHSTGGEADNAAASTLRKTVTAPTSPRAAGASPSKRNLLKRFSSSRSRGHSGGSDDKGAQDEAGPPVSKQEVAQKVEKIAKHIKDTSGQETQKWINEKYKGVSSSKGGTDISTFFGVPLEGVSEGNEDNPGAEEDKGEQVSDGDVMPQIAPPSETKVTTKPSFAKTKVLASCVRSDNLEDDYELSDTTTFKERAQVLADKANDKGRLQKRLMSAAYLNQKIKENSLGAGLIILNLPLSRNTPTIEFVKYTEALTKDLPKVVMLRQHGAENIATVR